MNVQQYDEDLVKFIAPTEGVVAGIPVAIKSLFLVPLSTKNAGEECEGLVEGHLDLPKAAEAVDAGDPAYFDDSTSVMTKTLAGTMLRVGKFTADALSTDATARVLFDGVNAVPETAPGA